MRMALGFGTWKAKGEKKEDEFGEGGGGSEYAEQMKLMDQDGDGLSDYAEMMLGTDATKRDSDGDTIPDGIEDANVNGVRDPGETNPAMWDSDMGGVNDGWELQNGYDPMNPDDDDRDTDGVLDDQDSCPGTEPGAEVGDAGCPTLTESVILDQVTFVEGTAELNPEAYTQLDQYAMILLQDPALEVVILVFGPPSGNKNKVKKMTEDQATAIKDYLIMRGLAEERLVVSGEGKSSDGPKVELQPIIPLF
jgi:outer membrane protein OmpA-like peptidoglycan-associated protein